MPLFRRKYDDDRAAATDADEPTALEFTEVDALGRAKKDRPTPSRREAEAARRERARPTLSAKEQRRVDSRSSRSDRMRAMQARDATPEKALLRDYVDSKRHLGEFLLPSLILILALTFLNAYLPQLTLISTVVMYLFILGVILDGAFMWRGFKKLLAERMPGAGRQGLLMYGMNRMIQIRRFRVPAPRIARGEEY